MRSCQSIVVWLIFPSKHQENSTNPVGILRLTRLPQGSVVAGSRGDSHTS